MDRHPIHLVVTDDLKRSRLTVLLRLILAIPHFLFLFVWGIAALVAWLANWIATVAMGRSPAALHGFLAGYLRYSVRVAAYALILADPFPPFSGSTETSYPIDLEIAGPEPQSRLAALFRLVLALPALLVAYVLRYLSQILAIFSWVLGIFLGRVPEGIRNFGAFCLAFEAQTNGYLYLLTQRYPSFNYEVDVRSGPPAS